MKFKHLKKPSLIIPKAENSNKICLNSNNIHSNLRDSSGGIELTSPAASGGNLDNN